MKVSIVVVIAALVAVIGYLMGTEDGRGRRDDLVARIRKTSDRAVDSTVDAVEATGDAVAAAGERVSTTLNELTS